jgi:hypothetical protein
MREILELMDRLDRSMNSLCQLRLCGRSWGIYRNDKVIIKDDGKRTDDPTDDIIAALKAQLPPTKEEALADLDAFIKHTPYPYSMAQNTHLQTVRRYLEAQKE